MWSSSRIAISSKCIRSCTLVSLTSVAVWTPCVLLAYAISMPYIVFMHAILVPCHSCHGHGQGGCPVLWLSIVCMLMFYVYVHAYVFMHWATGDVVILRCESKFFQVNFIVSTHTLCRYKKCGLNRFTEPWRFFFSFLWFGMQIQMYHTSMYIIDGILAGICTITGKS